MKDPAQFGPFLSESERHEANGDFKKAFISLLAGAKSGDSSCQINLGNAYADGKGVRKNISEAARWYKAAYRQGERCAANNLAIDRQTQGNIRSAIFWFKGQLLFMMEMPQSCSRRFISREKAAERLLLSC
jgi:TPR repeat protein